MHVSPKPPRPDDEEELADTDFAGEMDVPSPGDEEEARGTRPLAQPKGDDEVDEMDDKDANSGDSGPGGRD